MGRSVPGMGTSYNTYQAPGSKSTQRSLGVVLGTPGRVKKRSVVGL